MIRALVRSYGESSTSTLSPGTMRIKCFRIFPEMWASTLRFPGNSTRNMVPGKTCVTVPSVMICSSLGKPNGKQTETFLNRPGELDFSLRLEIAADHGRTVTDVPMLAAS
jgi:hypothetical protein